MFCGKCGKQNLDGTKYCVYCGTEMDPPPAQWQPAYPPPAAPPPTSSMAIASLVLGALGIITLGVTSLVGIVLGVISLGQISKSQGRVQGQGLAIAGIAVSAVMLFQVPIAAAILFPVFARSREKAVQTTCASNLKQLSLAMLMYCQDYDEKLPMKANWGDAAMPYLKNPQIYVCPTLPDARCGYAYNGQMDKRSISSVRAPAEEYMLFDARGGTWNLSGGPELADPRHNQGLNVGYVDGHVTWSKQLPTSTGSSLGPPPIPPPPPSLPHRR